MKNSNQLRLGCVILQTLALCVGTHARPNVFARQDEVPQVGDMAQGAAIVLKVVLSPGTDTNVTFGKLVSPSASLRQSDSLVCLVEAVQQIYSNQSAIKTHLPDGPWTFSGSDGRNAGCLTMSNDDNKDHMLTWGIVAEALSAVAIGLSNTTATSCQFDVYNGRWGHLGYGGLGMQYGDAPVDSTGTSVAAS
ncbi:MAG: hypothetical protein Q9168_004220 [Polycauliona sp. 1 TL-2023]